MKSTIFCLLTALTMMWWGCSTKKNNPPTNYPDYEKAKSFHYYKIYDSAFILYNQFVSMADDSLLKGQAYRYMGDVQWITGDLPGAEESATGAIKILNENDSAQRIELMYTYNLLGNIRQDMREYDDAIAMYNKGISHSIDDSFTPELMNGKALAHQKKGEYAKAIAIYDSILLQKPSNQLLVARAIDNRSEARWLQNPDYPALPEYWEALKIRVESQENRDLNASYASLAKYYETSKPDSALWYANKRFQQALIIQSPEDRIEAMDKLIRLADPSTSKYWYVEYKRLADSFQLSKDSARKLYALIKYDSQKSKAANLLLQENVVAQRFWIYGLIAFSLLITIIINYFSQRRKKRIQVESENAIRDASLKTSQKVHDVVANGLYGIMNELEHGKPLEREPLLTRIERLYEKSRNISYEHIPFPPTATFSTEVRELLTSFANEQTKVILVGNQELFWNKMSEVQKQQLLLVLQELMINMKKHSEAKNVVVAFTEAENKASINYKDDGKGFSEGFTHKNGLNNTVNRIISLKGAINFGKSEKEGAAIYISLPLEPNKI